MKGGGDLKEFEVQMLYIIGQSKEEQIEQQDC